MKDRYRRNLSTYSPEPVVRGFLLPDLATLDAGVVRAMAELAGRSSSAQDTESDRPEERRRSARQPYPQAMLLTPCSAGRIARMNETATVVATDLSKTGVGLIHHRAMRDRQEVVLTFQPGNESPICVLARIRSSEPLRRGMYLLHCEFLERIPQGDLDGGSARQSP